MRKRLKDMTRLTKLLLIAPLAILGMAVFCWIGGEVVKLLWNWLAPALFGLRTINFWQALGLLALCRILFGGFGHSGAGNRHSHRRMEARIRERVSERMAERWERMTDEERERFSQGLPDRGGRTTPLDSNA
jgi:uncharacterized membrane protein